MKTKSKTGRATSLVLVLSMLVGACSEQRMPTSPSMVEASQNDDRQDAQPIAVARRDRADANRSPLESVRVIEMTENHIDAEVSSAGDQSLRVVVSITESGPAFMIDGRPVTISQSMIGQSASDDQKPQMVPAVLAAVSIGIRIYAVYEVVRVCAPPAWSAIRSRSLSASTWDSCLLTAAANVASWGVANFLKGVGVTALRGQIYSALKGSVTWSQLNSTLNKKTFKSVVELISELSSLLFEKFYAAIYNVFRRY